MPRLRFGPLTATLLILTLVGGAALVLLGAWTRPLVEAGRLESEGRAEEALTAYRAAADGFERFAITKLVFTREHAVAVAHELALLYRAGDYNAVVDRSAGGPAAAAPRLWAGLALMQLGMREGKEDIQLTWFSRAEEELRLALTAAPDDWDTKVNYEIAARIVSAMRRQPKRAIENPMQLLRPQPAQGTPPRKVG